MNANKIKALNNAIRKNAVSFTLEKSDDTFNVYESICRSKGVTYEEYIKQCLAAKQGFIGTFGAVYYDKKRR